ncbi:hypothetical protein ACX3PU_03565 [Chryseobacterium sp. A301]
MNPKTLPFFLILALARLKAQGVPVVVNDKLLEQVSKNQVVRLGSSEALRASVETQRKAYGQISSTMTQIISIEEYLYQQLYEVNSLILSGKQLEYFYWYLEQISSKSAELLVLSSKAPEHAVLLSGYYTSILKQSYLLQEELLTSVLSKDIDVLLNSYDRQLLLEKLLSRARSIHGYLLYLILRLKSAHPKSALSQIPALADYINLDKQIVKNLLSRYRSEFN